jgi:thiol:disulfide interchange protein
MSNGVTIWLVIFALSASGFFLIALIVSINGIADLRSLLQHSEQRDKPNAEPEK